MSRWQSIAFRVAGVASLLVVMIAGDLSAQQLPQPIRSKAPKKLQGRELKSRTDADALKARRPDPAKVREKGAARRRDPAPGATKASSSGGAVMPILPSGRGDKSKSLTFDAKEIEKEIERAEVEEAIENKTVDDVITFKTNFEKEVKCQKLPLDMKINLDMQDAPLEDLVKFFSCVMEKNFLLTGGIPKGKNLTILATRPITVYEAWKAFLSTLEANNMTLVKSGAFLKIVEIPKAKSKNIPLLKGVGKVPDDDSLMTVLVPLENIEASEVEPILSKFKSAYGDLTIYQPTNTIFLTDNGTTIRKIMKILKELDVPGGKERIWIRQIEYSEASEIATKIQEVFGDAKGSKKQPRKGRPTTSRTKGRKTATVQAGATTIAGEGSISSVTVSKVIADERTNQLIIMANRSSYMRVDKLIRKLDVPIEGEGAIHIYYLENGDAEEVSSTLSNLISGSGSSSKSSKKSKKKKSSGKAKGGVASLLEGDVKITADKGTNSLVIQASLKDFLSLKKVVQKLDIRRKQVYVEAVIMEITSSKDRKLGFSGSAGTTFDVDGETVPMLFGLGGLGISGLDMSQLTKGGLAMGMQGPLTDVSTGSTGAASALAGTLSVPTFGFLLQAIQSNSDVNVLSTPHILTLDNEEAEIQVGKQIPYRSSSMGGMGGLSSLMGMGSMLGGSRSSSALGGMSSMMNPMSMMGGLGGMGMVQRIDVDLSLKITPQVNESNFVKLKIEQSVEDVEALDVDLGPTTSKRKVNNVVVVRDQQPVVIGGLIRDTQSEGVDKIPILGDIPVIGILFRKTVTRIEKKNLLMIITPYIINDPSDLKRIHEEKNEEMRRYSEMMATDTRYPTHKVDYRKKHGALEEINQVVGQARKEREQQERMLFEDSQSDTVGPADTHDIDYDPFAKSNDMDVTPVAAPSAPVVIDLDSSTSAAADWEKSFVAPTPASAP